jgi:glutamate 5-kinase
MNRFVIKIGTGCIINKDFSVNYRVIKNLIDQIYKLKKNGNQVLLITSGALGCGKAICSKINQNTQYTRHTLAALGQVELMKHYDKYCKKKHLNVCQFLINKNDLIDTLAQHNILNTLEDCLRYKDTLPIVNENDATAIEGFKFKDNDELTSLLSRHLKPSRVFFLTSVNGVYKNSKMSDENLIKSIYIKNKTVEYCDKNIYCQKCDIEFFESSALGLGGMKSKVDCCIAIAQNGSYAHISNANEKNVLFKIIHKAYGTTFHPEKK